MKEKVDILKVEEYPNCKKITVGFGGKQERFSFSHKQYKEGVWKKVLRRWVKETKIKNTPANIEGKKIDIELDNDKPA